MNASVIRLRRNRPNMTRPYEIPFYPAPPLLAILLNLGLAGVLVAHLWTADPLALALSAGWLVLGAVAFYALRATRGDGPADEQATDRPDTTTSTQPIED